MGNRRQQPPERELGDDQRERLRHGPVSPWDPTRPVRDPSHRESLASLFEATGERGLPMPGGFLLDPLAIEDRLTLPRHQPWQVPLGYHPCFGLLLGNGGGLASLLTVTPTASAWMGEPPTVDRSRSVARSWPELLDYLFSLEDLMRRAYVVWVWLGQERSRGKQDPSRWHWHRHVLEARRRAAWQQVCTTLELRERFDHGVSSIVQSPDGRSLAAELGSEALVGSDDADHVERLLRCASKLGLRATPEAWGDARDHGPGGPRPDDETCYSLDSSGAPRVQITARRQGDVFVWAATQDAALMVETRVPPGRAPIPAAPLLPGGSARLHRELARRGAFHCRALCSVEAIGPWLRELDAASTWGVLAEIERITAGLVLGPAWGLTSPERLGPYLIRADQASLEPLGLNDARDLDDDEEDPIHPLDHQPQRWPFVQREGIELAVIGLERPRVESALCTDRQGTIYRLDHEFDQLTVLASDILTMLEKRALIEQDRDGGHGLLAHPAFALPLDPGDALPKALGLVRIDEASDRIDSYFRAEDCVLRLHHEHPLRPAWTEVHAPSPARAVELARGARARLPDATIHVRFDPTQPSSRARRAAFEASDLEGLTWVDALRWGRWSG